MPSDRSWDGFRHEKPTRPQVRYLHDAVPVIPRRNLEEREEGHSKVFKGGVAAHPLAGIVSVTHWRGHVNTHTEVLNVQQRALSWTTRIISGWFSFGTKMN